MLVSGSLNKWELPTEGVFRNSLLLPQGLCHTALILEENVDAGLGAYIPESLIEAACEINR
jgi:hypothetical protein